MKPFLNFLLLLLSVCGLNAQSYTLVSGYENLEHRFTGFVEKSERIFTGTKLYNKNETTIYVDPAKPASESNCYVTCQYIWATKGADGLHIDRYLIFHCDPTVTPHSSIVDFNAAQAVNAPISYPDTRIDNTYTVAGDSSNWSYCRSTWELTNSQAVEFYFPFKYTVHDTAVGQRSVYTGFNVSPGQRKQVVVRWEDLRLDTGVALPNTSIHPPAFGPYFGAAMVPVPVTPDGPWGVETSGSYTLPTIPTPKDIKDYLELSYFKSLNK